LGAISLAPRKLRQRWAATRRALPPT